MATNSTTTKQANDTVGEVGGKTPYINAQTASSEFTKANQWLRPYFDPIDEFERIARNRPSDRIPSELPKVTDGTMAAIIQEDPKRVIQQLATGMVTSINHSDYAAIADIVHRLKLLPNYHNMGTALQKHWNMLSKARTWGRSASYTFFTQTNGVFHTDFVIPYVKDVITERGKVYAPDSKVVWMRSWYQASDIKAIIAREQWMTQRKKGYKSEWNLTLLQQFLDAGPSAKPANLQTPAEKEKGDDAIGFEVIHAFQEGIGAEFYSFAPRFQEGVNLRTKVNPDPRGKIPIDFEYCNIDLSNPLGRGSVEASGGVQNLIDQQMQMFQFMTTLLMAPPLQVWGTVKTKTLKYRPNAVWKMGTGGNNKVEPYIVNNTAISQFAGNYGLLKSQIMNLNNSQDHSISASDAPGQSKTQAGVQASEARLGVSDNYMRKQHEAWFEAQAETSINLYFAEMTAPEQIQLEDSDINLINRTAAKKYLDKKGILTVPHNEINKVSFTFQVDASSSEVKEDLDNADKLTQTLALIQKSQDPEVRAMEAPITKILIKEIGAEGIDDLLGDNADEGGNAQQAQGASMPAMMQQLLPQIQQMVAQMIQQSQKQQTPKTLGESIAWKPGDLTPSERAQALQQVGVQADQSQPTPNDVQQATTNAMEIAKTAHQQALANHGAASQVAQNSHQAQMDMKQADMQQQQASQPQQPQLPQGQAQPQMDAQLTQDLGQLSPDESKVVEALIQQQFNDSDIEQAITMLRSGRSVQEVMQVLRSKYATA